MSDSTDALRAIIVGGGFSGTLVAIHLLCQGNSVHIDLIDGRIPGRGLAYSTVWDDHLLNVPAIRMSAFGSEPMHFLEWLHANGKPDADAGWFAPRKLWRLYSGCLRNQHPRRFGKMHFSSPHRRGRARVVGQHFRLCFAAKR